MIDRGRLAANYACTGTILGVYFATVADHLRHLGTSVGVSQADWTRSRRHTEQPLKLCHRSWLKSVVTGNESAACGSRLKVGDRQSRVVKSPAEISTSSRQCSTIEGLQWDCLLEVPSSDTTHGAELYSRSNGYSTSTYGTDLAGRLQISDFSAPVKYLAWENIENDGDVSDWPSNFFNRKTSTAPVLKSAWKREELWNPTAIISFLEALLYFLKINIFYCFHNRQIIPQKTEYF